MCFHFYLTTTPAMSHCTAKYFEKIFPLQRIALMQCLKWYFTIHIWASPRKSCLFSWHALKTRTLFWCFSVIFKTCCCFCAYLRYFHFQQATYPSNHKTFFHFFWHNHNLESFWKNVSEIVCHFVQSRITIHLSCLLLCISYFSQIEKMIADVTVIIDHYTTSFKIIIVTFSPCWKGVFFCYFAWIFLHMVCEIPIIFSRECPFLLKSSNMKNPHRQTSSAIFNPPHCAGKRDCERKLTKDFLPFGKIASPPQLQ